MSSYFSNREDIMLAIRDDDTSYWTDPDDLDYIYGKYIRQGIKLSLAVVPESYRLVFPGDRRKFYIVKEKHFVYENKRLVDYLRPYVLSGQIEIMLHGYDHSYCVQINGKHMFLDMDARAAIGENVPDNMLPECIYKENLEIKMELARGKEILEDTFKTVVKTFVPPSNALSASVVSEIERLGMNISGTMTNKFNREIDFCSLLVFAKKIIWKRNKGVVSYPYVMVYKKHKELVGHSFTPSTNYEKYIQGFQRCRDIGCDFTVATHYWELIENDKMRNVFYEFLNYAFESEDTACLRELFMDEK